MFVIKKRNSCVSLIPLRGLQENHEQVVQQIKKRHDMYTLDEGKEREDLLDDFARQLGRRQRWQPGRRRREIEGDV